MQKSYCDTLEDDLKSLLDELIHDYDAKKYEEASNIAVLLNNLIIIEHRNPVKWGLPEKKTEPISDNILMDYINDELHDAEKYIGIGEYSIARDELKHAQHFIDKFRLTAHSVSDKAVISDLQAKHDIIEQSIQNAPESKMDTLQGELKKAFDEYAKSKEEYTKHQTTENKNDMLNGLTMILNNIKQLIRLIHQSANTTEEYEAIKSFFQENISNYFNKNA